MDMATKTQCKQNRSHLKFNRREKRCRECGSSLVQKCDCCQILISYSNISKHRKCCKDTTTTKEEKLIRFAYVAAEWSLNGEGAVKNPLLGHFCDALPSAFPTSLRPLHIPDPTRPAHTAVDSYDAIWGSIAATDKHFELVHVYQGLSELESALLSGQFFSTNNIHVLVLGNWIHPLGFRENGLSLAKNMLDTLQTLEVDQQLRVFPPLDYCWYFARKAHYLNRLRGMPMPLGTSIIPTMVVPESFRWREPIKAFAKHHNTHRLVFKRELSEVSRHCIVCNVDSIPALAGRGQFRWIVQPLQNEFISNPELRMYVIDGKCTWGICSTFTTETTLQLHPLAPGRRNWETEHGEEAAHIAQHIVSSVRNDQAHANRFLRVDMVRKDDNTGWWINELEFFGNAYIHFEVFDNASELLDEVVQMTKDWVKSLA